MLDNTHATHFSGSTPAYKGCSINCNSLNLLPRIALQAQLSKIPSLQMQGRGNRQKLFGDLQKSNHCSSTSAACHLPVCSYTGVKEDASDTYKMLQTHTRRFRHVTNQKTEARKQCNTSRFRKGES